MSRCAFLERNTCNAGLDSVATVARGLESEGDGAPATLTAVHPCKVGKSLTG